LSGQAEALVIRCGMVIGDKFDMVDDLAPHRAQSTLPHELFAIILTHPF
jgi:hypothetical protein